MSVLPKMKQRYISREINKMSSLPKVPTVAEVIAGVKKAQSNIFKPITKASSK